MRKARLALHAGPGRGSGVAGAGLAVLAAALVRAGTAGQSTPGSRPRLCRRCSGGHGCCLLLAPCCCCRHAGRRAPHAGCWSPRGWPALCWLVLQAFAIGAHGWRSAGSQRSAGWTGAAGARLGRAGLRARHADAAARYGLARQRLVPRRRLHRRRARCWSCGSIAGLRVLSRSRASWSPRSATMPATSRPRCSCDKLTDSSIWGLDCLAGGRNCGVAWNSLAQAMLVGVLTTLLGPRLRAGRGAHPRCRSSRLLRLLSVLPVITPPFVIGLALILLFGRAGMVTNAAATTGSTCRAAAGSTACRASPSRSCWPSRRSPTSCWSAC